VKKTLYPNALLSLGKRKHWEKSMRYCNWSKSIPHGSLDVGMGNKNEKENRIHGLNGGTILHVRYCILAIDQLMGPAQRRNALAKRTRATDPFPSEPPSMSSTST
jgi:hypothetical protein